MNQLQFETSPYLLQHAHNPVHWYPWSDEALQRAKAEDKPILVSIGYAACHWCHVMERESFEDADTAAFMNAHFINIKIDREERPDLDNIYMNACQILTGAGGWPLNVFLTPDQLPFSAGTYFPPKPGYGKPAWMEVLAYMNNVFVNERDRVEEQASKLAEHIVSMDQAFVQQITVPEGDKAFSRLDMDKAAQQMRNQFDLQDGGFGNAPKFPGTMSLKWLMRYAWYYKDADINAFVQQSLNAMHNGGIYDHVEGGFARYATDKKWMIPHFEKMLYDNALLISLYAESYRMTGNTEHKKVVDETMHFVLNQMSDAKGGFYASYDADSEGVEGKYYTFTTEELRSLLAPDQLWALSYFNCTEIGNWEHTNILHTTSASKQIAAANGWDENTFAQQLQAVRSILAEARSRKIKPGLDNKIILGWNALMCSAAAEAFKATGNETYRTRAIENLQFLNITLADAEHPDRMYHAVTNEQVRNPAFLEDYAAFIQAAIDVYEITGEDAYLHIAKQKFDHVTKYFSGPNGMFFFTAQYQHDIPVRSAEYYDNATPSGNSMMAMNACRLFALTGAEKYNLQAREMLLNMRNSMTKYGTSFGNWLMAAFTFVEPYAEIAVSGPHANQLRDTLWQEYFPHTVMATDTNGSGAGTLLENRFDKDATRIFVCRNFACSAPVTTLQDFRQVLSGL